MQRSGGGKKMRRMSAWLSVLVVLAFGCSSGGGGGSCGPTTDISGLWKGPVTDDDVARGNPGTITAAIEQAGCDLGGTWAFDFEDPDLDKKLAIKGSAPETTAVDFDMNECVGSAGSCTSVARCNYVVSGTLVSPTEISGAYAASSDRCSITQSGSFDIQLQARLTPTPVPVLPTAFPTATPTP